MNKIDEIIENEFKFWQMPDDEPLWEICDVKDFAKTITQIVAQECIKICQQVYESSEDWDETDYKNGREMGAAFCEGSIKNFLTNGE